MRLPASAAFSPLHMQIDGALLSFQAYRGSGNDVPTLNVHLGQGTCRMSKQRALPAPAADGTKLVAAVLGIQQLGRGYALAVASDVAQVRAWQTLCA